MNYKLPKGWRQNTKASGGQDFYNKNINIFIDYHGNARIKEKTSGYWFKSIKIKKTDTFENIINKLKNKK
jgi:hypothetical protein